MSPIEQFDIKNFIVYIQCFALVITEHLPIMFGLRLSEGDDSRIYSLEFVEIGGAMIPVCYAANLILIYCQICSFARLSKHKT